MHFFVVVDCIWNEWHEWEQCSKSCGGGITSRTRNIKQYAQLGGQPCVGDAFQTKLCNNQTCPGKNKIRLLIIIPVSNLVKGI